jgi:hypothetical protein
LKSKLAQLGEELRDLCPGKKIEWWDSPSINDPDNIYAQPIREMGLVEYVKEKRRRGELDAIIFSPVARSQYSVLFEDHEEHLQFDFTFGLCIVPTICDPWEADQGLGRARQTRERLIHIAEQPEGIRLVGPDAGIDEVERLQFATRDEMTANERVWFFVLERYLQYSAANKGSREWLFREIVKQKGAKVFDLKPNIPPDDVSRYLKIKENLNKKNATHQKRLQSNEIRQRDLLNKTYRRKANGWGMVERDGIDWDKLEEAIKVDSFGAEMIWRCLVMTPKERADDDKTLQETYHQITYMMLKEIFFGLFDAVNLHKQMTFFDWFEHGDTTAFFALEDEAITALDESISNQWEYVRRTLDAPNYSCGSLAGFLRNLGNMIGIDFVLKVNKEERTKWREALFAQYGKTYSHIWVMNDDDGMEYQTPWKNAKTGEKYTFIEDKLREKLRTRGFAPTYEETRMLDTMAGVVRATKHPFISRSVISVYRHYGLRFSESPLNRNLGSNALIKKSAF